MSVICLRCSSMMEVQAAVTVPVSSQEADGISAVRWLINPWDISWAFCAASYVVRGDATER